MRVTTTAMHVCLLLASGAISGRAEGQQPEAKAPAAIAARAAIEVAIEPATAVVGQTVAVTVRVRLEQRLWREQLIQLFRQQTGIAARIATPWAAPVAGLEFVGVESAASGGVTAVVDGAIATLRANADEVRDGASFAVFELRNQVVVRRAGTLELPPAELRFAWAESFAEDFLGDRVPQDRQDAVLASAATRITVEELPSAGRPEAFAGLVGRFELSAAITAPTPVRVGDTVELRVAIAGDGDLRPFRAPRLGGNGFFARGVREDSEPGRRVAIYELTAQRAGAQTIPALAVAFYSPTTRSYEVASTAPIAVQVEPAANGATSIGGEDARDPAVSGATATRESAEPEVRAIPGVDVLFSPVSVERCAVPVAPPDFAPRRPPSGLAIVAWLALPWGVALMLAWWSKRVRTMPERLRARRRRAALRAVERGLADGSIDRGVLLVRFVATWLDCSDAAVIGPQLRERLVRSGIDAALAVRVDELFDALAGRRFGDDGAATTDADVRAVATELDAAWRAMFARERRGSGRAVAAVVVLIAGAAELGAQDPAAEAGRYFAAGDVARAFELYQSALRAGTHDPVALAFDLGTCAHRLGRPAEAVLWYDRALAITPDHVETRANLRLVRQQLGLADATRVPLARFVLDGALARIAAVGHHAVFALAAAVQILGLWLWRRRRRSSGTLLVAIGLTVAVVAAIDASTHTGEPAVVLRDGVRLLAEPHERSSAVGGLQPGEGVAVLEQSPRWARIRRGGDVGWVEAAVVATVAMR